MKIYEAQSSNGQDLVERHVTCSLCALVALPNWLDWMENKSKGPKDKKQKPKEGESCDRIAVTKTTDANQSK